MIVSVWDPTGETVRQDVFHMNRLTLPTSLLHATYAASSF